MWKKINQLTNKSRANKIVLQDTEGNLQGESDICANILANAFSATSRSDNYKERFQQHIKRY